MNSIIFRISVRNLLRYKFTSFVCVFGLSLGFVAYILIGLMIRYETSWDKSNENYDNIYVVQRDRGRSAYTVGANNITAYTPLITASLLEEFPYFEEIALIHEVEGRFLSVSPGEQFKTKQGLYADHNYFEIFTYKFAGNYQSGDFREPYSILLSETLAAKLFGDDKPAGRSISLDKKTELKVAGVYADLPLNTSVRPEYIISFSTLERTEGITRNQTGSLNGTTFGLLRDDFDPHTAEENIKDLLIEFEGMESETLRLSPLSKMRYYNAPDYSVVLWLFGLIGLFILLMSAFNYVNLSMANASTRGKEIAIKKMSGSKRSRLVVQFLSETVLLSVIAVAISVYIVTFLLPYFNNIMNTGISLDFRGDLWFWGLLTGSSVLIGLLAGIYPAFFMSSNSIVNLFKGNFRSGSDKIKLRKTLVLFQFAISVFLICLSLFFFRHVNHISEKDIGFRRDNLIYVQITSSVYGSYFEDFRSRLLKEPSIINASMSRNLPFINFSGGNISWEGGNSDEMVFYRPNQVTYDFISNMEMELVEGRDFSRDHPSDTGQACIINETAVRYFGWDDPVGKRLDDNRYTVIGVVRDYHVMDIHNPLDPVVLKLAPGEMSGDWVCAFRIMPGYRDEAIELLTDAFVREFPNDPFDIGDLESAFVNENAYKGYQTIKKSVLFFTVFNIFLAITGLIGLVFFSTARRTKEIGIRRINGSSVVSIFILLNREFFVILGISLIIAWPAYWMVYNAFPGVYKLPFQPIILFYSALIILIITLVSTGWQTWKASARNPVEALRYE